MIAVGWIARSSRAVVILLVLANLQIFAYAGVYDGVGHGRRMSPRSILYRLAKPVHVVSSASTLSAHYF